MSGSPEKPSLLLLIKLGAIAVHADEMLSANGHDFDRIVLEALIADPEVKQWIKDMGVYMPVKR